MKINEIQNVNSGCADCTDLRVTEPFGPKVYLWNAMDIRTAEVKKNSCLDSLTEDIFEQLDQLDEGAENFASFLVVALGLEK